MLYAVFVMLTDKFENVFGPKTSCHPNSHNLIILSLKKIWCLGEKEFVNRPR